MTACRSACFVPDPVVDDVPRLRRLDLVEQPEAQGAALELHRETPPPVAAG